ncbi:AI-2E family transporter YdiK [Paraburkholderia sp. NMBU_R16]|uniref:AI-2E family transporter YdiK n=1 Tax=Paraburkholderia sp. NMBU_R16 TaxID=2698676 RepID=UPI00349F862B|nr:AI-2E family transporter YdiK [Paraburkholderia sp. NMBU_R16]
MHARPTVDLARIVLGVLTLSLLIGGSLYILRPFLLALVWATMIVVATWPALDAVQRRLRGHRGPAVVVMLLALMVVIVLPIYSAVSTLAAHADEISTLAKSLPNYTLPPPPNWLGSLPLVGARATHEWQMLTDAGPGGVLATLQPYASRVAGWLLQRASAIGVLVLHLLLTVIICGILYTKGEAAGLIAARVARRVAPGNGAAMVRLVEHAIRAVALGVVVTALAQSALGGLGLWVASVPYAGVLTAILFISCLAQLGPLLPLLASVAWLFMHDARVAAILLFVWSIGVATLDNILRPILIRRAIALPMILVLAGVLGGLIAFGMIGLFIGPVMLAVTYALMLAWVDTQEVARGADNAPATPDAPCAANDPATHE